jgi:hypothetical protein
MKRIKVLLADDNGVVRKEFKRGTHFSVRPFPNAFTG